MSEENSPSQDESNEAEHNEKLNQDRVLVSNEDEYIKNLMEDVVLLSEYAIGSKEKVIECQEIHELILKYEKRKLTDTEINRLATIRCEMAVALEDVTIESLRSTTSIFKRPKKAWKMVLWMFYGNFSLAGWYLIGLSLVTCCYLGAIAQSSIVENTLKLSKDVPLAAVSKEVFEKELKEIKNLEKQRLIFIFALPYLYGGLGSCFYLMLITGKRLRNRTFNPRRFPEHFSRLILGSLSGGIIILFIKEADGVGVSEAALGFLGGYSIDFFIQTLDRVIAALLPKT